MIPKSGHRFSEKFMLRFKDRGSGFGKRRGRRLFPLHDQHAEGLMLKMWLRLLLACLFLLPPLAVAVGQSPPAVLGTWTGMVAQNTGQSGYTVVMTIGANAAETEYPELKCGGKLTRVGAANSYVFFTETITHGGHNSGGDCIDGTITVTPASDKLVWGWVGNYKGETFVAWGRLTRK
jgi:hypothetical protein